MTGIIACSAAWYYLLFVWHAPDGVAEGGACAVLAFFVVWAIADAIKSVVHFHKRIPQRVLDPTNPDHVREVVDRYFKR